MVGIAGAAVAAVGSIASGVIGAGAQSAAATKARRSQETAARQQLDYDKWAYMFEQQQREPWLQAGREGLRNLEYQAQQANWYPNQWDARGGPDPNAYRWQSTPTVTPTAYQRPPTIDPNSYRFDPSAYNFQGPQAVNAQDYRYTPTQALDPNQYRFQGEQALDPSQYRYTPTETGTLGRFDFKPPTVTDDPGYKFRLSQGQEALDASAAARGGLSSGAAQKALMRYGQDLGSQEYGAAYGRSWQQQQEQYERSRLMNMTEEERQRYANATAYGRDYQANQDRYGRGLTANQLAYERANQANMTNEQRQFAANQFNWGAAQQGQQTAWQQAQAENQMRYGRAAEWNQQDWGRAVQRQGLDFSQGLAADDLYYRRMVEENQLREGRGLAETQRNWQMDTVANERDQARAWQEYEARIAEQQRNWNQYAQLAGFGINQQNQLGLLGEAYAKNINSAYAGMGNAGAAGAIAQGNAWNSGLSNVASGLSDAAKSYMSWQAMQPTNANRMGFNAAGQQTSGTLPTSMADYYSGAARGLYSGQ